MRPSDLTHAKGPLATAGEIASRDAAIQLGALIGATITLSEIAAQLDAKKVEMAKQVRDSRLWEQVGFSSWEDCCKSVFGPKRTVNRKISELEEHGADFFGISAIVRVGKPVFEQMDVQDGHIMFNNERVAITKANEQKIREVVSYYRDELQKSKETLATKEGALQKEREKAKRSKDEAERAKRQLDERDRPQLRWQHADEDHALLLSMQADLDFLVARMAGFAKREISPENQTRAVAFAKYAWAAVHQSGDLLCGEYGAGLNAPVPAEWLDIDAATADRRDLVVEYNEAHLKR